MDPILEKLTENLHEYLDSLSGVEKKCLLIKSDMIEKLLTLPEKLKKSEDLQYVHDFIRSELEHLPEPVAAPIRYIIWGEANITL